MQTEDITLAMAQELRQATEAVERRLRARQLGLAWAGLSGAEAVNQPLTIGMRSPCGLSRTG